MSLIQCQVHNKYGTQLFIGELVLKQNVLHASSILLFYILCNTIDRMSQIEISINFKFVSWKLFLNCFVCSNKASNRFTLRIFRNFNRNLNCLKWSSHQTGNNIFKGVVRLKIILFTNHYCPMINIDFCDAFNANIEALLHFA